MNHFEVDIRKPSEYCLNPEHPVGKHKARVFTASLGIGRNQAAWLKQEILKQIENATLQKEFEDEYGVRNSAVIPLEIDGKQASLKTIWIIRSDKNIAELLTCFIHN